MTSFVAGDPGVVEGSTNTTTFTAPGVASASEGGDDTTVVLEVGGRKFTKTDLIKKITNADQHIENLNRDLAEQRKLIAEVNETVKKQLTATELLAQIKAGTPAPAASASEGTQVVKPVTVEDVLAAMKQEGNAKAEAEAKAAAEQNWRHVTETLTKTFGSKTDEEVRKVAAENEMSLEEAAQLARSKPKAFLKLFGNLSPKPQASKFSQGNVNPIAAALKGDQQRVSTGFVRASLKESVQLLQARYKELGL